MDFAASLFLALIGSFFFAITANEYRDFFSKIARTQTRSPVVPLSQGKRQKAGFKAA